MNSLRMNNIYARPEQKQESNYPMYNEFLKSIAPMLHARRKEAEQREAAAIQNQQTMQDRPVPQAPLQFPIPQEPAPMNVRFDPSGGAGMTPYQMAQLEIRKQGADSLTGARNANIDVADRRMDLAEAGGSKLEQIDKTAGHAMDRLGVTGTQNMGRDAARENAANVRQERAAEIATKLQQLRGVQSIEAIKLRDELEREMVGLRAEASGEQARLTKAAPGEQKPLPPSQQRIARNDRAMQLLNAHPEWKQYLKASKDGFTITKSGNPQIDSMIENSIYNDSTPVNRTGDIELPGSSTEITSTSGGTDKRARAIAALQKAKKVVNETTIASVMARLK